jgi:hypothetical protein
LEGRGIILRFHSLAQQNPTTDGRTLPYLELFKAFKFLIACCQQVFCVLCRKGTAIAKQVRPHFTIRGDLDV